MDHVLFGGTANPGLTTAVARAGPGGRRERGRAIPGRRGRRTTSSPPEALRCGAPVRCSRPGLADTWIAATHGLFLDGAVDRLAIEGVSRVRVTNSVRHADLPPDLIEVVSLARVLAGAIRQFTADGSLQDLYRPASAGNVSTTQGGVHG
jgi:hypothetical protein